ncbi:hypothetical protein ACTXN8_12415 [Pseudomonas helleri]|uniref:hypothetical protein n=1 Tax=Pseudomonas helleri TaxID=1608996 RepID=UPI003FD045B5
MPAGRGKECEKCAWEKTFARRARIQSEGYEHASVRERFTEFCLWLNAQMGAHKAALKLKQYLSFFVFLDSNPVELPSYATLLNHFHADGLRRMQTPMLWLSERYGIQPDEALREEHSDKRRIDEMIDSVPKGLGASALIGYRAYLMVKQRSGGTTIRSVRLSMRAAKSILASASEKFDELPTQQTVTEYLTKTPGQKAASQGFISYLNRTHDLSLNTNLNMGARVKAQNKKLEAAMREMFTRKGEGDAFERNWIKTALMLLHGLPNVNKKALSFSPFSVQGEDGYNVVLGEKTYWVPGAGKPHATAENFD